MNAHTLTKGFAVLVVVIGIAVLGHHAILWGNDKVERIKKQIACDWLGSMMLEQPTERKDKLSAELMVLEAHCWKSKRLSALVRETSKRKG